MRERFEQKQKLITGVCVFLGVWLLLGGLLSIFEPRQQVKSHSASQAVQKTMDNTQTTTIFEQNLKTLDRQALTDQGVFHRFEIKTDTATLSEDGKQVTYEVILNNDPALVLTQTVEIDPESGRVRTGDVVIPGEVFERLIEHEKQTRQPEPVALPEVTETADDSAPNSK